MHPLRLLTCTPSQVKLFSRRYILFIIFCEPLSNTKPCLPGALVVSAIT
jgi:hypothetical protein